MDVPSTLSARARLLATGGNRKTDAADALYVAQVALFRQGLRTVEPEDQPTILRLLTERHDDLVNERTRIINRLHAVLRDLLPGGAPTRLSAEKAAALMKGIRPATATDPCRRVRPEIFGDGGRGQEYYLRKIAEGKTPAEARRALKRDRHKAHTTVGLPTAALISVSDGASRTR